MENSVDPDETAHMSRLIWIYIVCKSICIGLQVYFYIAPD